MIAFSKLEKHPFLSESIYNWTESNMMDVSCEKSRYLSKHSTTVKEFYQNAKSAIPKTMGYSQTPLSPPQEYLKKHSRDAKNDSNKSVNCLCRMRSSKGKSVPKAKEAPAALPADSKRNFLAENALEVLKRPSTTPVKRVTDSRKGDTFDLEESGLIPKYIFKEDYGTTPNYIKNIRQNLVRSREEFEKFLASNYTNTVPRLLSMEDREEILQGLVRNMKGLLKMYLTLPLNIETLSQIERKKEIESRIDDIQMQIDLIQRNKDILVGRND